MAKLNDLMRWPMVYSNVPKWLVAGLALLLLHACSMPVRTAAKAPKGDATATAASKVDQKAQQQFDEALKAMQAGQDKQAEALLLSLTQSFPNFSGPYVNLGIINFRANRPKEAESFFAKALAINQRNKIAHNYMGVAHRNAGRFDDARKAYEAALAIDQNYASAHLNLGILLDLYLQDSNKALEHYEKYQQLTAPPDKQVSNWIADLKQRAPKPATSSGVKQ